MSLHLLTRYGLKRAPAGGGDAGGPSWDFSAYALGEQPSDWTARWATANAAWTVRRNDAAAQSTDFSDYAVGAPAEWTPRWATANAVWGIEEDA